MSFKIAGIKRIRSKATMENLRRRHQYFRRSRAADSIVSGHIRPKLRTHTRYYKPVFVISNLKKDPINNKQEKVETSIFKTLNGS